MTWMAETSDSVSMFDSSGEIILLQVIVLCGLILKWSQEENVAEGYSRVICERRSKVL